MTTYYGGAPLWAWLLLAIPWALMVVLIISVIRTWFS